MCPQIRFRSMNYIYQGQPFPWERLWSWVHCSGLTACISAELPSVHFFPRPLFSLTQPGGHVSTWRNQNVPTWPGPPASQSPFRKQQWLHPTRSDWGKTNHYLWFWDTLYVFNKAHLKYHLSGLTYVSRQCAFWWQENLQ